QLHGLAHRQHGDRAAVQEGAGPAQALEHPPVRAPGQQGVLPGHRRIADHDVVVGAPADPDDPVLLEAVPSALAADLKLVHRSPSWRAHRRVAYPPPGCRGSAPRRSRSRWSSRVPPAACPVPRSWRPRAASSRPARPRYAGPPGPGWPGAPERSRRPCHSPGHGAVTPGPGTAAAAGASSSARVVSSALPSSEAHWPAHSGSCPASHDGGCVVISPARSALTPASHVWATWALPYPSVASRAPSRGVPVRSTAATRNESPAPGEHRLVG